MYKYIDWVKAELQEDKRTFYFSKYFSRINNTPCNNVTTICNYSKLSGHTTVTVGWDQNDPQMTNKMLQYKEENCNSNICSAQNPRPITPL